MSIVARSQKELAETIGIGERTFAAWLREGCPGDSKEKRYVVSEVLLWARENKWETDPDGSLLDSIEDEDLKRDLVKERIEKLKRENRLADFKIEDRDASLVDIAIIKRFLDAYSSRLRSAIDDAEKVLGAGSCTPIRDAIDLSEREIGNGSLVEVR